MNGHDLDRANEYWSEEFVQHGPFPGMDVDAEEALETLRLFMEAFPDMQATEEFAFTDGEYVCSRYRYSGTHERELMGIEPTDMTVEIYGTVINRIDGGSIDEAWVNIDLLSLYQQIGAVPDIETLGA